MSKNEVETVRVVDDGVRVPKIRVLADTGKKYPDGNPILASINLYKWAIHEPATEENPYGRATEKESYRIDLGKFPKQSLSEKGAKDLIAGLQLMLKTFKLEENAK